MSEVNVEAVQSGLKATRLLRGSVRDLIKLLSDGPTTVASDDNESEQSLKDEIQNVISNINARIRELETQCTLIVHPGCSANINLGNSGLLAHDPAWERSPLYSSLLNSYRWSDRVAEHATHVLQILSANSLKKSGQWPGATKRSMNAKPVARPVYSVALVDQFCANLQRLFANTMHIELLRPFGVPAVLKVTLERVLRAVIVLRGASIEWVLVKGYSEDFYDEAGKIDIWTQSRYLVFQKITDNANAAMLHFVHSQHLDLASRSFVVSILFEIKTSCYKHDMTLFVYRLGFKVMRHSFQSLARNVN
jgi:mediator of RNA polymerase II transcription subunit 27